MLAGSFYVPNDCLFWQPRPACHVAPIACRRYQEVEQPGCDLAHSTRSALEEATPIGSETGVCQPIGTLHYPLLPHRTASNTCNKIRKLARPSGRCFRSFRCEGKSLKGAAASRVESRPAATSRPVQCGVVAPGGRQVLYSETPEMCGWCWFTINLHPERHPLGNVARSLGANKGVHRPEETDR
jgi:hypothetical protein